MNELIIDASAPGATISPHIYGQFAEHLGRCIYDGVWGGGESSTDGFRVAVLAALDELSIPNIRWPGGCFADTYHWLDGVGPRDDRPGIVNVFWGGTLENNHFGTHEFFELCTRLNCDPFIVGNVGSGTVREMAEWLEYITHPGPSPMAELRQSNGRQQHWPLTYWGVGNENWGCGGRMRAEYYADEFRRYATYCRNFSGSPLYKIACGHDEAWNEKLLSIAAGQMNGLSIHYYTMSRSKEKRNGSATNFSPADWNHVMKVSLELDGFIARTIEQMDRYDPKKRIGLIVDEWGTWYDAEPGTNPSFLYQQNTMRDALVAGISLNIFHQHADRVHMANIAQMVNVLQAMVLTEGPRLLRTPTFHVFEMYKPHRGAQLLKTQINGDSIAGETGAIPALHASASRDAGGRIHLSLCNLNPESPIDVTCKLTGAVANAATGRILTGSDMADHNTFDAPNRVIPQPFDQIKLAGNEVNLSLPAHSVAVIELN